MQYRKSVALSAVVISCALLIGAGTDAQASYLDPGSASFLFQMGIAGLLGFTFAFRRFFGRWKMFFTRRHTEREE
ncbi:MAG: hypothetical protein ACYDBB_24390 [Armatimonadota bacterium]